MFCDGGRLTFQILIMMGGACYNQGVEMFELFRSVLVHSGSIWLINIYDNYMNK